MLAHLKTNILYQIEKRIVRCINVGLFITFTCGSLSFALSIFDKKIFIYRLIICQFQIYITSKPHFFIVASHIHNKYSSFVPQGTNPSYLSVWLSSIWQPPSIAMQCNALYQTVSPDKQDSARSPPMPTQPLGTRPSYEGTNSGIWG